MAEADATGPTTSGSPTTSSASSRAGSSVRAALRERARDAAMPFKCLMRADRRDRRGRARAARAPAAGPSGSAPNRDRSACSTRWRRARASNRSTEATARCCTRPASRSASSCSSAIPARRCEDIERTLEMVRACAPDDIGVSVSYPLPGTTFYERVQAQLGREAELGGLERPRDDVSRHLLARSSIARCTRWCTPSSARRASSALARAERRPWTAAAPGSARDRAGHRCRRLMLPAAERRARGAWRAGRGASTRLDAGARSRCSRRHAADAVAEQGH